MPRVPSLRAVVLALPFLALLAGLAIGGGTDEEPPSPAEGYRLLLEKAYIPPAFDDEVFDALWQVWPEPLRSWAEAAPVQERRRLAFLRYGLTPRPGEEGDRPLQFVVDAEGRWSMSCFACHAGEVAGRVIPGLGNSRLALETLVRDVRATKLRLGRPLTPQDLSVGVFPFSSAVGTTNAVMFSVSLLQVRNEDLELVPPTSIPRLIHHDLDAPPWWNVRTKDRLYIDGFGKKHPRTLMQFTLVPANGPEQLHAWDRDFEHIMAFVESVEAPRWPYGVDAALAARGRAVFEAACARCHGTYGADPTWPGRTVPIADVGTDPLRLRAVKPEWRARYARSWLTGYDPEGVDLDPVGYVPPPLHGIWASAPYLHNGSVPTLWHMLHPEARPKAWRRAPDPAAYDTERVGLEVEVRPAVPPDLTDDAERRTWYDTSRRGLSAEGHLYPAALSEDDRRAVLEYLKTL